MTGVCIDGYNLALPKGTGIATYGRNLLANLRPIGLSGEVLYGPLSRVSDNNVANEATIAHSDDSKLKMKKSAIFARTLASRFSQPAHPVTPTGGVIWPDNRRPDADRYWLAPSLYRFANRSFSRYGVATPVQFVVNVDTPAPSVMHWTSTTPVHARGIPNIYTFHDLIPLRLPHVTTDDIVTYLALCRLIIRRADHITVVSETTRRDVIELLGVPEERVTNTYQAVSLPPELTSRSDAEVMLELEGIFDLGWKGYFLHFGAIEPKKNLARIVEAYLASGLTAPLILVGGRAWMSEAETALLDQVKLEDGPASRRIRQYEYLPFSLLLTLIRGARATVFPSLYEGFGLPVLESMMLGTPVLTSTAGSLPEISGGAAILCDPYDARSITRAMQALDSDEGMCADLASKGLIQAAHFTPEAYQARLRGLYEGVGVAGPTAT